MCFICGRKNPVGLRMDFYQDRDAERILANLAVPDRYQGYPGVVHGGIVAAILDEVAGRAVLLHRSSDDLMATLRLTIRYRQPTPTETALTVVGWIERLGGAGGRVAGEIRLSDGTVTAECESLLAPVPDGFRERWDEEKKYWKVTQE
jgi:acyl-coenzyme A thioesterase PaaI-like protein